MYIIIQKQGGQLYTIEYQQLECCALQGAPLGGMSCSDEVLFNYRKDNVRGQKYKAAIY